MRLRTEPCCRQEGPPAPERICPEAAGDTPGPRGRKGQVVDAHLGRGRAFVEFKLGDRALDGCFGIDAEAFGRVDDDFFDEAFGEAELFGGGKGVEGEVGDPEVRVPGGLGEELGRGASRALFGRLCPAAVRRRSVLSRLPACRCFLYTSAIPIFRCRMPRAPPAQQRQHRGPSPQLRSTGALPFTPPYVTHWTARRPCKAHNFYCDSHAHLTRLRVPDQVQVSNRVISRGACACAYAASRTACTGSAASAAGWPSCRSGL